MNTEENRGYPEREVVKERRQDKRKVEIVEHGIMVQADYGYVRAAQYLYRNGINWPVIQRVLNSPHRRRHVASRERNRILH